MTLATSAPINDRLSRILPVLGFFFVALMGTLYVLNVGPVLVWPETYHFADRARHLLEAGNFAHSGPASPASTLPLYSLLMLPGFLGTNLESGHTFITLLQALFLGSMFFPLQNLLARGTALSPFMSVLCAALACLLPLSLAFTPMLRPELILAVLVLFYADAFDRLMQQEKTAISAKAGIPLFLGWCGRDGERTATLCLTAMLLLHPAGWVVYGASLMAILLGGELRSRIFPLFFLIPLLIYVLWIAFRVFIVQEPLEPLPGINNGLARFNFVKNGLLYLLYAGAPLAGFALLFSGLFKGQKFWDDAFKRFVFFAVIGAIFYAAFATTVIVDRRLDFISNAVLEPFFLLPLVIFLRSDRLTQKEIFGNGLLLLFVLMVLGLPYGLHTDFSSGLSYWAQSLSNPNYGLVRNIMFLALMVVPGAFLFLRPTMFMPSYLLVMALLAWAGAAQNGAVWAANEDNNLHKIAVRSLRDDPALKEIAITTDFFCDTQANNDPSYMFRCFDVMKALYFTPTLARSIRVGGVLEGAADRPYLFISSEHDSAFGPVVAQVGLAKFMKPESADAPKPLVTITKIEGLRRYLNIPYNDVVRRLTGLDKTTRFHLRSSLKACAVMKASLFFDDKSRPVTVKLNDKLLRPLNIALLNNDEQKITITLPLDLLQGESVLQFDYGQDDDAANPPAPYNLMMLERPSFTPCGIGKPQAD